MVYLIPDLTVRLKYTSAVLRPSRPLLIGLYSMAKQVQDYEYWLPSVSGNLEA
jgi:hypothetical protein